MSKKEWKLIRLNDLVENVQSGFASGKRDAMGTLQVRMNNLTTEGSWNWSKKTRVPASKKQIEKYSLKPGDVLVNTTNSPNLVGKTVYFSDYEEPLVFSNHFVRLRLIKDRLDPNYLRRWLNVLWSRRVFEGMCTQWVNQASVRKDDLLALQIPLSPIEEQRRIAAILDKADEIRRKRQEAIALTDELLRSTFLEMFGDPVTNPMGWRVKKLEELANFVGGGTPSRKETKYYQGQICWATSKDIKTDVLKETQEHITREAIEKSATKLVNPECLLMVVKSKILLHRLPVTRTVIPICFGQDIKAIVPHEAAITRYLHRHIQLGQKALLKLARGVNTEGLVLEHLRNYKVMIPPAKKAEFFRQLDTLVEKKLDAEKPFLTQSNNLFNCLLQKAFKGEL